MEMRCILCLLLLALSARAQMPPCFAKKTLLDQMSPMSDLLFLDENRILISEKIGKIWIAKINGFDDITERELYLDLGPVASILGDKGLLDMILDTNFAVTRQIYIYYSRNSNPGHHNRKVDTHWISRFTHMEMGGGTASRAAFLSEIPVWVDPEGYPTNVGENFHWHFGAQLDWGPDGLLYFAQGDKMIEEAWSSDVTHFAGCVIRMHKNGSFPLDNYGAQQGGAPGCWGANGLRSPWRSRWDLETERYIIADVGGNNHATGVEELHIVHNGEEFVNFGWPACEGSNCGPDVLENNVLPVHEYPHLGGAAAIIGGFVYRGAMFPPEYRGLYLFGDYGTHIFQAARFDESGRNIVEVFDMDENPGPTTTLEQAPDGSIFYATHYGELVRYAYVCPFSDASTNGAPSDGKTTTIATTTTTTSTTSTTTTATTTPAPFTLNITTRPAGVAQFIRLNGERRTPGFQLQTEIGAPLNVRPQFKFCIGDILYKFQGWNVGGPDDFFFQVKEEWPEVAAVYKASYRPSICEK